MRLGVLAGEAVRLAADLEGAGAVRVDRESGGGVRDGGARALEREQRLAAEPERALRPGDIE